MVESRAALAKVLGTSVEKLVYTQNVTISLNIVPRSLELGVGDEVLSTDHEYGALDRTWHFLAKEHGFTNINQKISVPLNSACDFVDAFWRGVTLRTCVIFLSHITSPTAIIFPIEEIIQRTRAEGMITVVDGAHVPGQIPLDLDALGADFYGGNLQPLCCLQHRLGRKYNSVYTIRYITSRSWERANNPPLVCDLQRNGHARIS